MNDESPFAVVPELDRLFGEYYASKNRNDYFDESGKGKFKILCDRFGIDHISVLEYAINSKYKSSNLYCHFKDDMEFCGSFPCFFRPPVSDQGPYPDKQLWVLFFHLYKHRRVPSDKELCNKLISQIMSWSLIAECVRHQMSAAISTKMKEILDDSNSKFSKSFKWNDLSNKALKHIVADLQMKKKMTNKEVHFIERIVKRAREVAAGEYVKTETPTCICGTKMKLIAAIDCCSDGINCDRCHKNIYGGNLLYHCPLQVHPVHKTGYDICLECAAKNREPSHASGMCDL